MLNLNLKPRNAIFSLFLTVISLNLALQNNAEANDATDMILSMASGSSDVKIEIDEVFGDFLEFKKCKIRNFNSILTCNLTLKNNAPIPKMGGSRIQSTFYDEDGVKLGYAILPSTTLARGETSKEDMATYSNIRAIKRIKITFRR